MFGISVVFGRARSRLEVRNGDSAKYAGESACDTAAFDRASGGGVFSDCFLNIVKRSRLSQAGRGAPFRESMIDRSDSGASASLLLDEALEDLARERTGAFDRAFSLAYDEVKALAHARLAAWSSGLTLSPTALVHEAYLKVDRSVPRGGWQNRSHFLAFLGKAMRHILVDHARARGAQKRGGGAREITLITGIHETRASNPVDLLALERALSFLGERDPRLERVVECKFFAGMTTRETAEAMDSSIRTVERDWTRAKLYLHELLEADFGEESEESGGRDELDAAGAGPDREA